MAHECFEDAEVAAQMNASFICVKVDREERPTSMRSAWTRARRSTAMAAGH